MLDGNFPAAVVMDFQTARNSHVNQRKKPSSLGRVAARLALVSRYSISTPSSMYQVAGW